MAKDVQDGKGTGITVTEDGITEVTIPPFRRISGIYSQVASCEVANLSIELLHEIKVPDIAKIGVITLIHSEAVA